MEIEERFEVMMKNDGGGGGDDDNSTTKVAGEGVSVAISGNLTPVCISEGIAAANDRDDASISREEGELLSSSDDDDDQATETPSQSAGCDTPQADQADTAQADHADTAQADQADTAHEGQADTAQMDQAESVQASPLDKVIQDAEKEQHDPAIKSSSMVGPSSSASQQSDSLKSSEKNRGPFVPFLISFSDDDSGSDSDNSRHNTRVTKDQSKGVDRSSMPPVSSLQGSQKLLRNRTKKARIINRNPILGRPHVPSNISGATSWNSRQISRSRNFSALQKGVGQNQKPLQKSNVHLNINKKQLQDLRDLIAMRESQLKLKSAQQTKSSVEGSCAVGKVQNPGNPGNGIRKTSGFDLRDELKRTGKRLKTGEPQSSQLDLDYSLHSQQPSVNDHSHRGKKISSSASPFEMQKQSDTRDFLSLANPINAVNEGKSTVNNKVQFARDSEQGNCAISLKQSDQIGKDRVGDFPNRSLDAEKNTCHDVQVSIQNNAASGNKLTGRRDCDQAKSKLAGRRDFDQAKSSDQVSKLKSDDRVQAPPLHVADGNLLNATLNSTSSLNGLDKLNLQKATLNSTSSLNGLDKLNLQKATLNSTSSLNGLDKLNMMGNNMDLQSLLEYEELQDKELEEAQEHRHRCEIEERNALMAYRKAQRALIEANVRCSHLYSKRELYSAQVRSLMIENPNLVFSLRQHDQIEAKLDSSNYVSDVNVHLVPTSRDQVRAASDVNDFRGCDSNVPCAIENYQNLSSVHVSQQNLVSDVTVDLIPTARHQEHAASDANDLCGCYSNVPCASDHYQYPSKRHLSQQNLVSDVNVHQTSTSRHQMHTASDVNGIRGCDSSVPCASDHFQNPSNMHVSRQNLVSDPSSESEESSSEGHERPASNGVCSPSGDLSHSSYEEGEIFEFDCECAQENIVAKRTSEINEDREKDVYEQESQRQQPCDNSQDSLLLEASLRSQLFEKLKTKKFSKRETAQSMEALIERKDENDDSRQIMEIDARDVPFAEAENGKHSDSEDYSKEEQYPGLVVQIDNQFDTSRSGHASSSQGLCMDNFFSLGGQEFEISGTFLLPSMKSALSHLKVIEILGVLKSNNTSTVTLVYDVDEKSADSSFSSKSKLNVSSLDITETSPVDLLVGQSGYYSCSPAIDPFWPLCMYELRGRCNNNECSWQHVKDYCCGSMKHDSADNPAIQVKRQSSREEVDGAMVLRKSLNHVVLGAPIYVVGLDIMRPDSQSCISTSPQGYGQCWGKCYSAFLVLSSLCPMVSQSNEPFLHGTQARIEVHSGWNRQASYFNSRNGTLSHTDQRVADVDQSLEMALLNFNQEADKYKARIQALKVLAHAIEDSPTSAVLWIVYLQIFYSNQKSIIKDDLFQYAVEYNKESYELWLLYINSRVQLDDRLAAYNTALLALSHHATTSDVDSMHASQCTLDIFLQMMNFLCMSGYAGIALEKISGLFLSTRKSDDDLQVSLPEIVTCLTHCDKFIFWICCVYILVYRSLPDPVVQKFECTKESSGIEWPSVSLSSDDKQQALSLLELAVDSLALYMDHESLEDEPTLRAAHLFALNHVRCVSVLEGLECSRNLLGKYINLYPSCLELVLMSARAEYVMGCSSFNGFEEALRNWPDEFPGIHCFWNQYVGYVFHKGNFDYVRDLVDHWYHSVLDARNCDVVLETEDEKTESSLLSTTVPDLYSWFLSRRDQNDTVFGMLNLSLHMLLQNNLSEARAALDLALKAATADTYQHCLRELVPVLLIDSIKSKGSVHLKGILNILNVHLVDDRASLGSVPLSRDFLQKIKKPGARQLVSKLLSPASANYSLMNLLLEVWYGLTLLPRVCDKVKDMVDFVEALMEILPSNYLLAFSVCKKLNGKAMKSASLSFWASSLLVNALFCAVPIAPEYAWVKAADVLHDLTDIKCIQESFHKKALSIYPFSIKLWKSFLRLCETEGNAGSVIEAAKEKGIKLD